MNVQIAHVELDRSTDRGWVLSCLLELPDARDSVDALNSLSDLLAFARAEP